MLFIVVGCLKHFKVFVKSNCFPAQLVFAERLSAFLTLRNFCSVANLKLNWLVFKEFLFKSNERSEDSYIGLAVLLSF